MKRLPSSEFFIAGFVASLRLTIDLRRSGGNVAMRDARVRKVLRELGSEGGIVVCLDFLDHKGEMLSELVQELDRCRGVVVVVGA